MKLQQFLTGSGILLIIGLFKTILTTPAALPDKSTSAMANSTATTRNITPIQDNIDLHTAKPVKVSEIRRPFNRSANGSTTLAPRVLNPKQLEALKLAHLLFPEFDKIQKNGILLKEYQPNPMGNLHPGHIRTRPNQMNRRGEKISKLWFPSKIVGEFANQTGSNISSNCETIITFEVNPKSLENVKRGILKLRLQQKLDANGSYIDDPTPILVYGAVEIVKNGQYVAIPLEIPLIASLKSVKDTPLVICKIGNFIQKIPLEAAAGEGPYVKIIFTLKRACDFDIKGEPVARPILSDSTPSLVVFYNQPSVLVPGNAVRISADNNDNSSDSIFPPHFFSPREKLI